jgi:hypothetical protein
VISGTEHTETRKIMDKRIPQINSVLVVVAKRIIPLCTAFERIRLHFPLRSMVLIKQKKYVGTKSLNLGDCLINFQPAANCRSISK